MSELLILTSIHNQNASPTADWAFYYIYFNALMPMIMVCYFMITLILLSPPIHTIVLPIIIVFLITLLLQEIVSNTIFEIK